ncbi:MAG: helix-turn-helix domain-containing protein [Clostridia bacterium]|nr:helix-turn-helix domain-containing protein [Clostridia bacterium]
MPAINYIGKNFKTYDVKQHKHSYWELIYCTGGSGTIIFENAKPLEYNVNEIVVIPPNTLHSNTSQTGFKNIHMTVAGWTPSFKNAIVVKDNQQKDLFTTMDMCYRHFSAMSGCSSNIIMAFTDLILGFISQFDGSSQTSQHIELIANAIIENFYDANFSIDSIYSQFDLSKDYIRRQFIKEKGVSPLQFLNQTRINSAQKLLLSRNINNLKIYEIAERCGFNDQLYFSRVFKKFVGVSPKEYIGEPKNSNYNDED